MAGLVGRAAAPGGLANVGQIRDECHVVPSGGVRQAVPPPPCCCSFSILGSSARWKASLHSLHYGSGGGGCGGQRRTRHSMYARPLPPSACARPSSSLPSSSPSKGSGFERAEKAKDPCGNMGRSTNSGPDASENAADEWQIGQSSSQFLPMRMSFGNPKVFSLASALACGLAVLTSVEIGSYILKRVEAIPLLAGAETLLGLGVCVRFTMQYLIGGAGRARLESMFEGVLDRILGTKLIDISQGTGPSMLEVQLRSVVDRHLPSSVASRDGGEQGQENSFRRSFGIGGGIKPINSNNANDGTVGLSNGIKQMLIASLLNFISEREAKSRRINAVLREDREGLQKEREQLRRKMQKLEALLSTKRGLSERVDELERREAGAMAAMEIARKQKVEQMSRREEVLHQQQEIAMMELSEAKARAAVLEEKATKAIAEMTAAKLRHEEEILTMERELESQKELTSRELQSTLERVALLEQDMEKLVLRERELESNKEVSSKDLQSALKRVGVLEERVEDMIVREIELENQKEVSSRELQSTLEKLAVFEEKERDLAMALESATSAHALELAEKENKLVQLRSQMGMELEDLKKKLKVQEAKEAEAVVSLAEVKQLHALQIEEKEAEFSRERQKVLLDLEDAKKHVATLEKAEAEAVSALDNARLDHAEALAAVDKRFKQKMEQLSQELISAMDNMSVLEKAKEDAEMALQSAKKNAELALQKAKQDAELALQKTKLDAELMLQTEKESQERHLESREAQLRREREVVLSELKTTQGRVAVLEEAVTEATAELEAAQKHHVREIEEKQSILEKAKEDAEMALQRARADAGAALQRAKEVQDQYTAERELELEQERDVALSELRAVQEKVVVLERAVEDAALALEAAQKLHLEEIEANHYLLEKAKEDAQSALQKAKDDAAATLLKAQECYEQQLAARELRLQQEREVVLCELKVAQERVSVLERRVTDATSALEAAQNRHEQEMVEKEREFPMLLRRQALKLEQEREVVLGELKAERERADVLERAMAEVTSALEGAQKHHVEDIREMEREIPLLKQQALDFAQEREALSGDLKASQKRVEVLERAVEDAAAALEAAQKRHVEGIEEKEGEIEAVKQQALVELDATVERMEESLEVLRSERQYFADAVTVLETRIEQLLEEREEKEATIAQLEAARASTKGDDEEESDAAKSVIASLSAKWQAAEERALAAEAKLSEKPQQKKNDVSSTREKALSDLAVAAKRDLLGAEIGAPTTVSNMTPEKVEEIKAYARGVRGEYLDLSATAREQKAAIDAFAKVLEERGADFKWARSYIVQMLAYTRRKKKD